MSVSVEEMVLCRMCAAAVEPENVCPVCGYCGACSAGMPEARACFNCVEIHRLIGEFLGVLAEWDLERYGPDAADACHKLYAVADRIEQQL